MLSDVAAAPMEMTLLGIQGKVCASSVSVPDWMSFLNKSGKWIRV